MRPVLAVVRLVHPAPTAAVVLLSVALAAILSGESGLPPFGWRTFITGLAVLGSQVLVGALNDWADRRLDAVAQPGKPIPAGDLSPTRALAVATVGAALQLAASAVVGWTALGLGLVASAAAVAYDLRLSRTPLSFLPYLISFGVLPLWVAAGVGVSLERVAVAPWLVGPFAVAAHLANTVRDYEGDRRLGSRNLAQTLGRDRAFRLAVAVPLALGVGVGAWLGWSGRLTTPGIFLGAVGLVTIAQGAWGPARLWAGMLIAAVCWTAAWALGTG